MNIAELKARIANLPDNVEVIIGGEYVDSLEVVSGHGKVVIPPRLRRTRQHVGVALHPEVVIVLRIAPFPKQLHFVQQMFEQRCDAPGNSYCITWCHGLTVPISGGFMKSCEPQSSGGSSPPSSSCARR